MATEQSGDPGRTPGSAEGDLETVEEDLDEKGLNQEEDSPSSNQNFNQQKDHSDRKKTDETSY